MLDTLIRLRFSLIMQMREAAERVLFSNSLVEKLALPPEDACDDEPGKAIIAPSEPERPKELQIVEKGVRAEFPSENRLDEEGERGKLLHFLANHELLAAELMALVLLRFPDAPKEYRKGVYEAMREEQMHTLMYMRRMNDCGISFGELPVNDYFWRLVSPMRSPMEFVTRLNLTFEQANLDFSKHYAGLFRQVGDTATANVLEKIYKDEIGHVGHGVKWFRQWKEHGSSDWDQFKKFMVFPYSAAKAKGIAPFNAEGRKLAGLDDDFIAKLEVFEQSRGRTPIVHYFNPYAEEYASASLRSEMYMPNKMAIAMENDCEMVLLGPCRQDDIVLLRQEPNHEHLTYLKRAGLHLPEFHVLGEISELGERKLGGLRPWAWSPDAATVLRPFSDQVSDTMPWQWRESIPPEWLSKELGVKLLEKLGFDERPVICRSVEDAITVIEKLIDKGPVLLKGFYGCAGREHFRVFKGKVDEAREWLERVVPHHGGVVVELFRHRALDFSALYEMNEHGAKLVGMSVIENDDYGRFKASRVAPKWGSMLYDDVSEFLYRDKDVMGWYMGRVPDALAELLPDYVGPVCVDSMVYFDDDLDFHWLPVVEVNVRMTMGRVAHEMLRKSRPGCTGRLKIIRKDDVTDDDYNTMREGSLDSGSLLLTDPEQASEFLAVWEIDPPRFNR